MRIAKVDLDGRNSGRASVAGILRSFSSGVLIVLVMILKPHGESLILMQLGFQGASSLLTFAATTIYRDISISLILI